jgi:hypothetical protein
MKSLLAALLATFGVAAAYNRQDGSPRYPPAQAVVIPEARIVKINIRTTDRVIPATLNDSKAAQDFASLLPLSLTLEDYNSTEKISDLPRRLSTDGAPPGFDPSIGDIAYYAPWGNLAIFYRDFEYSTGLVSLGTLASGADILASSRSMQVTVELAPR